MPTLMVMLPALTAHSRAVCETVAWNRRLVGLGSPPGALTASGAAPERTSTPGQSRFGSGPVGAVAATFCWPEALPAENRFLIRCVKEEPVDVSSCVGDAGWEVPSTSNDEHPAAPSARMSNAASAAPPASRARPTCWPHPIVKLRFPS